MAPTRPAAAIAPWWWQTRCVIESLSYLGVASPNVDAWRTFGPDLFGFQLAADSADGAVRLRMDDQPWRLAIHPAESDDIAYLGWNVASSAALATQVATLEAHGIAVTPGDTDLAEARAVAEIVWFVDPIGFRHELSWGRSVYHHTFRPGRAMSGFLTGAGGMGHVVLFVPDIEAAEAFLTGVLGFRFSDQIKVGRATLRFLHCNSRHHTLALMGRPGMVGFHHLMVEVNSVDDVGMALDLVRAAGHTVTTGFGKHTNDLMTSFYVRTPSGFDLEYGYGGVMIDDATWTPATYHATSIWGHERTTEKLPAGIVRPVKGASA